MNHLLHEGIIGDFGRHTLVSVALAYRGIWIVKYWTLLAVPALLYLLYGGMPQGRDPDFLVFSLPGIFMLGLRRLRLGKRASLQHYLDAVPSVGERMVCPYGPGMVAKQLSKRRHEARMASTAISNYGYRPS